MMNEIYDERYEENFFFTSSSTFHGKSVQYYLSLAFII